MNSLLKIAVLSGLSATAAHAEWPLYRGAVQLETSLSGVYDSNLNGSAQNRSDYYLSFYPIVRYRQNDARFKTDVAAGVRIKRYAEYPGSDSEDADAHFTWTMTRDENHSTGAVLDVNYVETKDAVLDVNRQVRSRLFNANARGEVLVARRHLLSAGGNYRRNEHDFGSEQTSRGGRLGYGYLGFTDGTALNLNYQYQQSQTEAVDSGRRVLDQTTRTLSASVVRPLYAETIGTLTSGYRWLERGAEEERFNLRDRAGAFLSFAVAGPFLPRRYFPKTTGNFRFAYEQAEVPGMNDTSSKRFVGQVDVTWQARARTGVTVYLRRSQDLTIDDNTVVNVGGGLTVTQAIGAFVTAEAGVAYTHANFIGWGREDDRYSAHASARYALNRYWSARAGYNYLESHSRLGLANFERHVVDLTLTYAF